VTDEAAGDAGDCSGYGVLDRPTAEGHLGTASHPGDISVGGLSKF